MNAFKNKINITLIIICCVYFISLLGSINIPYMYDDVDHLASLVTSIESNNVIRWLFEPHNEHISAAIRLIYLFCYSAFGIYPQVFHFVIISVCISIAVFLYKLTKRLTDSTVAAVACATIWVSSNLQDFSLFNIGMSHIVFCLFLFLLMFYFISRYFDDKKFSQLCVVLLCVLFLPFTFSLGVTSVAFAILYYWLCVDNKDSRLFKGFFVGVVICALVSFIPYLFKMFSFGDLAHYKGHGDFSIVKVLFNFVDMYLFVFFRGIVTSSLVSIIMSGLLVFFVIKKNDYSFDKKAAFFFVFGAVHTLIILIFRSQLTGVILTPRYYVFPISSLALMFSMFFASYLKSYEKKDVTVIKNLILLLCIVLSICSGIIRFQSSTAYYANIGKYVERFYLEYRDVFVEFFDKNSNIESVEVKNIKIKTVAYPFVVSLSHFSGFLLPEKIRNRVIWGEKTDRAFSDYVDFVSRDSSRYSYIGNVL